MREHEPMEQIDYGSQYQASGSSQVIQIESSKVLPIIVILAVIAGGAIALAIQAKSKAEAAAMETRMLEYYLLELDAKAISAGIKKPEESIANKLKKEK